MAKRKRNSAPRKTKKKSKKPGISTLSKYVFILFLFVGVYSYFHYKSKGIGAKTYVSNSLSLKRTRDNYGAELENLGRQFKIPHAYLKALLTLECSGRKKFKPRFEKHVYYSLQKVRDGKKRRYGSIKRKELRKLSNAGLKNLATSWGPFQLMGYQCFELDIYVADIRGKDALYWGVYWIDKSYGDYLREGKFEDAFHIHNTGRPFPKDGKSRTYDPKYVEKGIKFMEYFEQTSYE